MSPGGIAGGSLRRNGALVIAALTALAFMSVPASGTTSPPPSLSMNVRTAYAPFHGYRYLTYPGAATVSGAVHASGWAKEQIEPQTANDDTDYLEGLSCPSTTLCVATDAGGKILVTTDPENTSAAWTALHVDGANIIHQVSCPTTTLCVAVDNAGNIITSTDPTGGPAAWTVHNIDGANEIWGISCPTATLCVADDAAPDGASGNILWSTNPTGSWTVTPAVASVRLFAISCPSEALCVAVGQAGTIVTSTDPTSAAPDAWTVVHRYINDLYNVSCSSVSMCAIASPGSQILTSTDPTGGKLAWTGRLVGSSTWYGITCRTDTLCLAVDDNGEVAVSTDPTGGRSAWPVHSIDASGRVLYNVVCLSASRCLTVDSQGRGLVSTNPSGRWRIALRASTFPFTTSRTLGSVMTTGHYSFTVHPALATRYHVVRTGAAAPAVAFPSTTVYVLPQYAGRQTNCTTKPTCKVVWTLGYHLPKAVAKTELAKRFYLYLGVTRGSNAAPAYLYRDDKATVRSWHVSGTLYRTKAVFTVRVGTSGSWALATSMCRAFTESRDGFGLPGLSRCGKAKVRNGAYLG